MPQVICRYDSSLFSTHDRLRVLGKGVQQLVLEAVSTEQAPLRLSDIDWLPQVNQDGFIAQPFALEIRTIGFPERKAKLAQKAVLALKKRISKLPEFPPEINPDEPFIWIQFLDPDGVHV